MHRDVLQEAHAHALAKILETAMKLVKEGWTRDVDARNQQNRDCLPGCPDVIAWSAQGAIDHATHEWRNRLLGPGGNGEDPLARLAPDITKDDTMEAFAAEIGLRGRTYPEDAVRNWNLHEPGQTTVVRALAKAAEHYLQRAANLRRRRHDPAENPSP